MRHAKTVFGALTLAIILAACADPTSPRPPDKTGEEPPPSTALLVPAPSAPASPVISYG